MSIASAAPLLEEPFERLPASRLTTVLDVRVVTGTGGGADKTVLNSPRRLAEFGYRNVCAYMRHPQDAGFQELEVRASRLEVPLVVLDDYGPLDWRVIRRLLRICRDNNVAIWHGHEYKSNLLGLLLRRFWPMRLISTVHGFVDDTWRLRAYNWVDRWCLKYYEHVLCVSEKLRQQCLAAGLSAEQCTQLDNGVDLDQYRRTAPPAAAQRAFGIPPGRTVVGAVGRLSREKAFDALIRVIHSLHQTGVNVHLMLAGEGDQEAALRRLTAELGCQEYVTFLGFQENTLAVYEAMDVFALSSVTEGMPNVLLEAMAVGVPVVATCVGAVPQLIESNQSGLVVPPADQESLARAIGTMVADHNLRRRCVNSASDTIRTRYSFDVRIRKVAALYDRLLARCPAVSLPRSDA
jgi:glycosyltransferase involved in cell wall biosynthesis